MLNWAKPDLFLGVSSASLYPMEATSANAVERTAAVEVAGPATQPSPEADAPDALAEAATSHVGPDGQMPIPFGN